MERETFFADVLLPLSLSSYYTYRVPYECNGTVTRGKRVVVQFGRKKLYTALVINVHKAAPAGFQPKYILSVLDQAPVVNDFQLALWKWMSSYYLCREGDIMHAALPSALKLTSETKLLQHPSFSKEKMDNLSEKEYVVAEAIDLRKQLTLDEIIAITGQAKVISLVKNLIEKEILVPEEELKEKYFPKKEVHICLSPEYEDEAALEAVFMQMEKKAPRRLDALMLIIQSLRSLPPGKPLRRSELTRNDKGLSAQLNALHSAGIITMHEKSVSRITEAEDIREFPEIVLSSEQQLALDEIRNHLLNTRVVLLHGVTSSGKTEIYVQLIRQAIAEGKQALFLLPEIALTTQIINRLRVHFGNSVVVYHSRYGANERAEVWDLVNLWTPEQGAAPGSIVLGARSSLFLPFSKLGLIIVDEEHDTSFKQHEPSPRYHARDAAIYLAGLHNASVVLGSATPAYETMFNAESGKYAYVSLNSRYGDMELPEVLIADLKEDTIRKKMKSNFSSLLFHEIQQTLTAARQVILFQNRRGFSLRLECRDCHWIPECKHCDVTLIYHKKSNHLRCHYCGYNTRLPDACPACGGTHIGMKGFGTERIEEDISLLFPGVRVARMDLDTTRSRHSYQKIINDFEDRNLDILVGTQMVTKGLDFDHVSLVGVMNADTMLAYPDFRSHERSFQLIAQVSGRAGRKNEKGRVIVQTFKPDHPVICAAAAHDYFTLYKAQLRERANFRYPPFYRLIRITVKHKESAVLDKIAASYAAILREKFPGSVLGPEYPFVSKIRNYFLKDIILKFERNARLKSKKELLDDVTERFFRDSPPVKIAIDVDPV
jgi:primosomal protein N' (replication factor Y) (superfamily II helicase)